MRKTSLVIPTWEISFLRCAGPRQSPFLLGPKFKSYLEMGALKGAAPVASDRKAFQFKDIF